MFSQNCLRIVTLRLLFGRTRATYQGRFLADASTTGTVSKLFKIPTWPTQLLLPTSIDFLKLPFDIRCASYEVVDFITHYSGFFNSNNLIAYTTGKSTGYPLLDSSAIIHAEAFPYVVKQNPIGLSHTTLLPLTDQRIAGYIRRTDNWNVFHHAINEIQFDLHKVWDADAAACIAKCANLRCILLMSHIDDMTVTERPLVPDHVLHVLAKNLSLDLLIINIHLSEYEGMRALEQPLSKELNEKWEWLDAEADKAAKVSHGGTFWKVNLILTTPCRL